jgi:hypothetical protein
MQVLPVCYFTGQQYYEYNFRSLALGIRGEKDETPDLVPVFDYIDLTAFWV